MEYKRYCILDTETTNVYGNFSAPIQIAALICDENGQIIDTFNERIKVQQPIAPEASAVHGIYAKDLINCRNEPTVITDFVAGMIGNEVDCLITYNGRAFDVPLLNKRCELFHLDVPFFKGDFPHIDGYSDCVAIAKKANLFGLKDKLGRKGKLTMVADALGINSEGAHDALVDVKMLKDIFFKLKPYIYNKKDL